MRLFIVTQKKQVGNERLFQEAPMIVATEGKPGEGMSYRSFESYRFQDRFRQIRKELKLTQIAMAEKMGVSLKTLQRYEKGTTPPTTDTLKSVAALGGDLHWLVTGNPTDNPGCTQVKTGVVFLVATRVFSITGELFCGDFEVPSDNGFDLLPITF